MSVSSSSGQAGMVSLVVLTLSSTFLLAVATVAAFSQLGPVVCVLARVLGLPPLVG